MTLVSSIIRRAYRRHNIIAKVADPDTTESSEALEALNGLIPSVLGNEAGCELSDIDIGGENDASSFVTEGVPDDCRLVVIDATSSIDLDPLPYEGQRVAVVDAGAAFATNNLALNGNGRLIEGAASVTLSTTGMSRQWIFRADTANWAKISDLATTDQMPFPQEFDEFFILRLALILNPSQGASMSQEAMAALERSQEQLRARYRKPRPSQDWGSLGLIGQQSSGFGSPTSAFNSGRG